MPLLIDGKEYMLPNIGRIKLFPIGKIAQALTDANIPRDAQTIRKWEKKGIIPPAIFRGGQKRLYSEKQIECIVEVAKACEIKQGKQFSATEFSAEVWEKMNPINEEYKRMLRGVKK